MSKAKRYDPHLRTPRDKDIPLCVADDILRRNGIDPDAPPPGGAEEGLGHQRRNRGLSGVPFGLLRSFGANPVKRLSRQKWCDEVDEFCFDARKLGETGTIYCFGENIGTYGIPRADFTRPANVNLRVVSA